MLHSTETPQAEIYTEGLLDTGTKETDFFLVFSTFLVFFLFSGMMYLQAGK